MRCLSQVQKEKFKTSGRTAFSEFNDVIAVDFKPLNSIHILHLIDLSTRYSNAVVIRSKHKDIIVKNIPQHWIALFGTKQDMSMGNMLVVRVASCELLVTLRVASCK